MPQYSLDNVSIDGFRGLRNLALDGLGPLNILVGENNSGKTSVLEALSILCNAYEPFEWLEMVRRRDFGGLDETRIHSLRWCFPQKGELADIVDIEIASFRGVSPAISPKRQFTTKQSSERSPVSCDPEKRFRLRSKTTNGFGVTICRLPE